MKKRVKSKKEQLNKITDEQICNALTKTNGALAAAAKILGKVPSWITARKENSELIRQHCERLVEERIDRAEQSLDRLLAKDNPTSVIFLLKTLGRRRGYIEHAPLEEVDAARFKVLADFFSSIATKTPLPASPTLDEPKDLVEVQEKIEPPETNFP